MDKDLQRLMELSGMKDSIRSNKKLNEMYDSIDEDRIDELQLIAKKFGDLRAKGSWDSKLAYTLTIKSKATGGVYILSIAPYGSSANRDGGMTETFINLSVQNTPRGEDSPDDLADAVQFGLDEFIKSGKFKKFTVQGFELPVMAKAKQVADRVASSHINEEQLDEIQFLGFGKGKKTGNFWVKTLNLNQYQSNVQITSELTNGVYDFDIEPYGESRYRGANADTIYVRASVKEQPEGKEDIKGLTDIIVNAFKKWEAKAKIKNIEVEGFNDPELSPAKSIIEQLCSKYAK